MKVYCKICTSAVAKLFNMHQTAFGKITTISEYKCALNRNWPSTDFLILMKIYRTRDVLPVAMFCC